jgi:serine/threonine protein kinase/tetratricopeptide (TPR) repeat protein
MTDEAVCLEQEVLMASALGEPAAPASEEQLRECAACRQKVERFREMVASLRQTVSRPQLPETTVDAGTAAPAADRPPLLGKYLVVGELGGGAQARVFRALDPGLDRDVAIKWAHESVAGAALDLLVREGQNLAKLNHPGIARVFELGVHEGRPFLAMEYVRGSDLEQYAAREKLSPRQAAGLVARLARALAYVHGQGVIHQDVKPRNILVDEEGRPRLADFGLAQRRDIWNKDAGQPSGGTLGYMAPEQLGDPRAVSQASDLYGLGGVLFFLLSGQPPREELANPILAIGDAQQGKVTWAPLLNRNPPSRLVAICRKALAADAGQRYQKAEDMALDLEHFVESPLVWRRRVQMLTAGLAALTLLILTGSWIHSLQPDTRPKETDPLPEARATRPAALKHFRLDVRRAGQGIIPKTQEDLDLLFPLHAGDKLRIAVTVPPDIKAGLFTLTLTDPNLQVRELRLDRAGGQLHVPGLVPLEDSPATEVLILCGGSDRAPLLKEVAALLADLPGKVRGPAPKDSLRLTRVRSFDSDGVDDPLLARVGAKEDDPEQRVADLLDQVRAKLRQDFAFVAGISFTHTASAVNAKAQRAARAAEAKVPAPDKWGGAPEDQQVFRDVMGRLLATKRVRKSYPSALIWPPKVYIIPNSKKAFNAFAGPYARDEHSKKYLVRAVITEGYMTAIVKEDKNILAAIMGHELAHITKGHLTRRIVKDNLADLVLSRGQEIEADLEGVKIALAASFDFQGGIRSAFREWKVLGDYSNFEGIRATHPSWAERLRLLDTKRADLWKAMAAFQNGYFFLHAEQYKTAETCFQNVTEEFPACAEAWANLGYARLMQYCDGLEVKDLHKYGIGHVVAGAFYARPEGLVSRGDEKKWQAAVRALKTALEVSPSLVLVRANLGLAYLVHPDGDKKTDTALEYFRAAYNQKDKGLTGLSLAAFLVNYGVAELAAGEDKRAAELFGVARSVLPPRGASIRSQVELALRYNEALLAAAAPDKDSQAKAFHALEVYLREAGPDST